MQLIRGSDGAFGVIQLYSSCLIVSLLEIQCSAALYFCWAKFFAHTQLTLASAGSQGCLVQGFGTCWQTPHLSSPLKPQSEKELFQGETVQRLMSCPRSQAGLFKAWY